MLAKIAALIAHEAGRRLVGPVLDEYRKLDRGPQCDRPHVGDQSYDITGTTGAQVERANGWDHDRKPPVTAGQPFGFGRPTTTDAPAK